MALTASAYPGPKAGSAAIVNQSEPSSGPTSQVTTEHAVADVVRSSCSRTPSRVCSRGWSTVIDAATEVNACTRACSRSLESTRSVASVTTSRTPTSRPSS